MKNKTKSQEPDLADFSLLIAQDLWQAHQILLILLKEFTN